MANGTDPNSLQNTNDQEAYLSANIEDYLLSLADSLQLVQRELNQTVIGSQDGAPSIRYQLPKLEFELKMSIEMAESTTSRTRGAIRARPVNALNSSKSNSAEAASIIKGVFVAVPIDGGKPPSIVSTSIKQDKDNSRKWEITVDVQSAVGQRLEGIEVQFNIDKEESIRLSELDGVNMETGLREQTNLKHGVLKTFEGQTVNVLEASPGEPLGTYIVVLVDVLGRSESLVFKVGDGAKVLLEGVKLLLDALDKWTPTDEEIFEFVNLEKLIETFKASLSASQNKLIVDDPKLLDDQGMQTALNDEFTEYTLFAKDHLANAFASWIPSIQGSFANEEAMKAAFIEKVDVSKAFLVSREDLWQTNDIADALARKFAEHESLRVTILLTAFASWSILSSDSFASAVELRQAFIDRLLNVSEEDKDTKAIAEDLTLWDIPQVHDPQVHDAWIDRYNEYRKNDLLKRIQDWNVTDGQKTAGTTAELLADEFYNARATLKAQLDELRDTHKRNLYTDSDILAAFTDKFDSLSS